MYVPTFPLPFPPHFRSPLQRRQHAFKSQTLLVWGLRLKHTYCFFFSWIVHFLWNFMRIFFLFEKSVGILKNVRPCWDPGGTDSVDLILGVICGNVWEGLLKAGNSQLDICISVRGSSITHGPYWITVLLGLAPGRRCWINNKASWNPRGETLPRRSYVRMVSSGCKRLSQTLFYLSTLVNQTLECSVLYLKGGSFRNISLSMCHWDSRMRSLFFIYECVYSCTFLLCVYLILESVLYYM